MPIEALDHVNIRTPDVAGTTEFFATVLDMKVRPAPGLNDLSRVAWVEDVEGRAVIHVAATDMLYPFEDNPPLQGPGSGRVHHVALRCTGYDAIRARLEANSLTYHTNEIASVGLRQLFVEERNAIRLELNFFGD
jgi:catechol 2,3-dioxygenase-like lactoylglutathione lyase family enzyme